MDILNNAIAGTLESSDAQVQVFPQSGKLSIYVESSVMNQYGRQIKKTAEETLAKLKVKENLGWAIVPEICLENFTGTVKPLFFNDGMPLERSTYLLYQPNLKVLPQIDAFIQFMTDWKEAFHE